MRRFDDVTAAREDPYRKISTLPIKRQRERKGVIIWLYALKELFYYKRLGVIKWANYWVTRRIIILVIIGGR